jgi:Tfp pilus assembly protein PilV
MNKSAHYGVIAILIIAIIVLSLMLVQNQNVINQQEAKIASQQQQIATLQAENQKLSEASPENLMRIGKELIKDKGASVLQQILNSK